ncbi:MAG: hypothetical protein U9N41_03640 [Euryarchaeota archaeon]|nr:hypothetical protein [Euryarchaeota archaeon]
MNNIKHMAILMLVYSAGLRDISPNWKDIRTKFGYTTLGEICRLLM